MALDTEKYMHYLDKFDMTEEQKVQCIQDVWNIVDSCVDAAFGKHPVQQIRGYTSPGNLQSPAKRLGCSYQKISDDFNGSAAEQKGRK